MAGSSCVELAGASPVAALAEMAWRKRALADRTVERRDARWAPFQGLTLWLDLTADWHGEAGATSEAAR